LSASPVAAAAAAAAAAAVAAVDDDGSEPASYTNFLPADQSMDSEHYVLAAPGGHTHLWLLLDHSCSALHAWLAWQS
jgi:hypothetical protein